MKAAIKTPNKELELLQKAVADLQLKLVEKESVILEKESALSEKDNVLSEKDSIIQSLNHQIHLFRTAKFGRKSEKENDKQMRLFDEATAEEIKEPVETKETITYTRKKKGTGRKILPKTLPFVENVYDLTDEEKTCPCGTELTHISDDITEQLDVLPQVTFRVVNIKKKYACKCCEETIKSARLPEQALPKSIATPGLLSAIIDAKFNRHLPLYRQEDIFKSMGSVISRATLSNWVIKSAELLSPLVKLMHDKIINYDIAYADETTLQVLKEPGRKASSKSYMWLFMGGPPDEFNFIYQYHPTRSEKVAFNFFEDFKGYLHADAYQAYSNLEKKEAIKHAACWAHARRYYMDIVKANKKKKGLAFEAVKFIAKLYKIEKELKENASSTEHIQKTRKEKAIPLLDELKAFLDDAALKVPPKSPIAKAIFYTLKHWKQLNRYTEDGRLDIDNNRAERGIKPFVIGRKNWLFHGNAKGANAGAILFSLVQTCKEHDIDVFAYFKFALDNIRVCRTCDDLEKLLPYNCKKEDLAKQRDIPHLTFPEKEAVN